MEDQRLYKTMERKHIHYEDCRVYALYYNRDFFGKTQIIILK